MQNQYTQNAALLTVKADGSYIYRSAKCRCFKDKELILVPFICSSLATMIAVFAASLYWCRAMYNRNKNLGSCNQKVYSHPLDMNLNQLNPIQIFTTIL
jgi:hypothetical protein